MKGEQLTTAVLMGGPGREREVSIESGKYVAEALKQLGVNVVLADVKPDELGILEDGSIDVFFIALHGTFGEDGVLQEILESKGLVYTGSRPKASRLAFDKWASKERFAEAGVATPKAIKLQPNEKDAGLERQIAAIGRKYVVKPVREGSTIGISIAENAKAAIAAGRKCAAEFGDCMIEEFIAGREITVGVIGKEALPILEIRARGGFYDYQAKYLDDGTEYLFDTINDAGLTGKIQKSAIQCFDALGCRGAARVDYILSDDGTPYVLEINTIPGMTKHSLLPKAAEKAGISMSKLCLKMVEMAVEESPGDRSKILNPKSAFVSSFDKTTEDRKTTTDKSEILNNNQITNSKSQTRQKTRSRQRRTNHNNQKPKFKTPMRRSTSGH